MRILFKLSRVIVLMGFLFYLTTGTINAQQSTDFIPRSPEASMLRQYGNGHNVNAMGLASIDIPLHEISIDGLTIPISINYVSDGIRVNEMDMSPVGLKWVLNFGGMVSRSIMILPDDEKSGWCSPDNTQDFTIIPDSYDDYKNVYNSGIDYAADQFAYSFLGYNGAFFIQRGTWDIINATRNDLGISNSHDTFGIQNFTMYDGKGNCYFFADKEQTAYEISTYRTPGDASSKSSDNVNGWKISQISSIKGEKIQYFYESHTFYSGEYISEKSVEQQTASLYNSNLINTYITVKQKDEHTINFIKEIESPFEKMTFYYNQKPRVDSIVIASLVGNEYKTKKIIYFSYDSNNIQLKSIRICGENGLKDSSSQLKYEFEYDTRPIPPIGSTQQDIFGYINSNTSENMIPSFEGNVNSNREIDSSLITTGMLKKITYPTRGYSEYLFGPNKGTINGVTIYGPGVRVCSVKNYTKNDECVSKTSFRYNYPTFLPFAHTPGTYPKHSYIVEEKDYINTYNPDEWGLLGADIFRDKKIWSSNPIPRTFSLNTGIFGFSPLSLGIYNKEINGCYYTLVTTVLEGNGTITDRYFFQTDGIGIKNLPSSKTIYSNNAIVKQVENFFTFDSQHLLSSFRMTYLPFNLLDGNNSLNPYFPPLTNFDIDVDMLSSDEVTEKTFNTDGSQIVKKTTTHYSNTGQPKIITEEQLDGNGNSTDIYISKIRYSDEDYSPEAKSSSIVFPSQTSMLLNVPIEENTYLKRAGQDTLLTGSKVTLYDIVPIEVYKLNILNPVNPNAYRTYNREVKLHYNDKKRVEQIDLPDKTEVLYWSSNGQYPLAKFDNTFADNVKNNALLKSKLDELFLYSKIDSPEKISALNALNSSIRQLIPQNVFITTYTYDPGVGVTSITDPNGVTTFYDYDSQGRLKIAKDFNGNTLKQYDYHYNGQAVMDELFSALVTFNSQGGSSLIPIRAPKRTKITAPADPSRFGYTFLGWFKEPNCINPWNYSVDSVMSDVTLYAKWVINSYTINSSVVGSGGTVSPSGSTSVTHGSSITYTFTPSTGYHVKSIKVNGSSVGNMNSYTFANITSNQTIAVEFEACILNVNTSNISFTSNGGTKSFSITSNTNWTIINNLSWLTITPSLGNGSTTVTVNASKTISDRFGNITISGDGITKTIIVSQEGVLIPLEP